MKLSFGLITTLISVALCAVVHAAPAPLCDRTNGLRGDIAARDVADSMMVDGTLDQISGLSSTIHGLGPLQTS